MIVRRRRIRRLGAFIAISIATLIIGPHAAWAEQVNYSAVRGTRNAPSFLVTRFGAKCDGITDDTKAFQAALDTAGAGCQAKGAYVVTGYATVLVPNGASCRIDSGLTDSKSDCVGISSYAGATLDFTGLANGRTALTLNHLAYGAYAGNVAKFEKAIVSNLT
jgi:hypothetical protein